jgi:exopolysaccharide biosynthesis polyprenyl glycosylphosphotransferase
MLREQAKLFALLNRLADHGLLIISILAGILAEQVYHDQPLSVIDEKSFHPIMVPLVLIFWHILFQVYDKEILYRRTLYSVFFINQVIILLLGFSFLISISFLSKTELFYRTTIIAFSIVNFTLLLLKRWVVKYYLENIRKHGRNTRYIMIVGSKSRARKLINEFSHHEEYGYIVSHILDPDPSFIGKQLNSQMIESINNFGNIILNNPIDEVFFALPPKSVPDFEEKLDYLNSLGINFHVMVNLDVFSKGIQNLHVEPFMDSWYDLPVISFHPIDKKLFRLIVKTYIEFIISLGIVIVFIPVLVLVPVFIKFNSKGPVFFYQERVGYHGRKFNLLKFRTMESGAESKLDELLDYNKQSGPVFKMDDDPRITGVGKILRKFSLDELPQLYNVIKGDMNLVGPRPPLQSEVDQYIPEWHKRLNMKPGITGLWQVSGRNDIADFKDWVALDLQYIDNWSLKLDLIIILKTIPHMFKGSGK